VSRRGWVLFVAMCVIWGIPYLLIRVAIRDFSPGTLVFARTVLPAVLLLPVALRRGMITPLIAHWKVLVVYTIVEIAGPWLLLSEAEKRLTSSLAGLLIASVPLIGAALVLVVGSGSTGVHDRLDGRRLLGLAIGFFGVVTLVGIEVHGADFIAVGQVALTALGYATGPLIINRRLADLPTLGVVAVSLALTAVGYAPYGLTHLPASVSAAALASVLILALVCTAVAFVLFFALIAEVGPARATVITYVNPAVAVLLGVALLDERFTRGIAIGFPLIIVGSLLATARSRRPVAEP
jgi:drug/metabolite transporter (DMT)-like permease